MAGSSWSPSEPAERAALRERATRLSAAARARRPADRSRPSIPGRVARVWVTAGAEVEAGDRLLSIEAMKMENEIRAPHAGTVLSVVGRRRATGSSWAADLAGRRMMAP